MSTSSSSSSITSPCAACKFLRRKCAQECVFAPYFPPDQPHKFAYVHKVFGASNVSKLLNEINTTQREDAVNSLFYEAEARLRDPVYGCVGLISVLIHRLKQLQSDLYNAKKELAAYIGPQAMFPVTQIAQQNSLMHHNINNNMGVNVINEQMQPEIYEAQQKIFAAYQQQQQEQPPELQMFNGGFEMEPCQVTDPTQFNHVISNGNIMSPSLGLGNLDISYHQQQHPQHPQHPQMDQQILLEPPQLTHPLQLVELTPPQNNQIAGNEEQMINIGSSS